MGSPDCLFCKIVAGEIPATRVHADERITAFRDIDPQARVHVLVIPNEHIADTEALEPQHEQLVGAMVRTAAQLARQEGVAESGYRLVLNTGPDSLNSVPHLHLHLIGGRKMGWPPG
jgi:histidine triad (HIT) family protein